MPVAVGARHRVITAVVVRNGAQRLARDVVTVVQDEADLSDQRAERLSRLGRLAGQGRRLCASRGRPGRSSRGSRAATPLSWACRWPKPPPLLQAAGYPVYGDRS